MNLVRLSLLSLAAFVGAGAAHAQSRSVSVPYADLAIERPAGVETLQRRIRKAARSVCGPVDARDLRSRARVEQCVDDAVGAALARVDRAALERAALAAR